ncbi:MAG: hypothetical protein OHK0046_11160 [Anaerolineae bacterium]
MVLFIMLGLMLPAVAQDDSYTVQPGDTLDTIAQELNISVVALQLANPDIAENNNRIFPGDALVIPADAPAYGAFPALDVPDTSEGGGVGGGVEGELYVVQPRDTLDTIAQEFDVSLIVLREANSFLESDRITPGQTLLIPADAPAYGEFPVLNAIDSGEGGGQGGGGGEVYTIQRGDTLDTIAQEFDVSVVSLQQVNELEDGDVLQIGQQILIPLDAPAYGMFPALDTAETSEGGGVGGGVEGDLYVVQLMDTIDQIAADYNVAVTCITEANAIDNVRLIKPGQTLVIPLGCPAYTGAAVARPDSTGFNAAGSTGADETEAEGETEEAQPLGDS